MLEKYISLFPPIVQQTEGGATAPIHLVGTSSTTDEKRKMLCEWVCGQMRAGEMANRPEMLECKQRPAQQGPAELWQSTIGKKQRMFGQKGRCKTCCITFLKEITVTQTRVLRAEGGVEEWDNMLSVPAEMPTKRRQDTLKFNLICTFMSSYLSNVLVFWKVSASFRVLSQPI
jgi:hypothetical protein